MPSTKELLRDALLDELQKIVECEGCKKKIKILGEDCFNIVKVCSSCGSENIKISYPELLVENRGTDWDEELLMILEEETGLSEGEDFIREDDGSITMLRKR